MEELIFYKVGLDKQVWKNINIIQIQSLETLLSKSNVSVSGGSVYKRTVNTSNGKQKIGKIKIHDSIFNLEMGVIASNGNINKLKNFERLEFNPSGILHQGINFNPIVSTDELIQVIEIIKSKLSSKYGIVVDFKNAIIKQSEININLPLQHKMQEYKIPLDFLLHKVLKKHTKKFPFFHDSFFNGIYCGNGLIELKMYEKNKECGVFLEHDTLRIEYKLLHEDKVIEMLGTNILVDILEDFNIVSNSFYKTFEADIYNRIYKAINNLVKENLKIYNSFSNESQQFKSFLSSIDANSTFDYLIVKKMISHLKIKKNQKSNMRFIAYKKLNEKQTRMLGNIDLLNEILIKLKFEPIVI
ncbi:TPA: hypothetical protein ACG3HD_003669 [Clostridioides difficile]